MLVSPQRVILMIAFWCRLSWFNRKANQFILCAKRFFRISFGLPTKLSLKSLQDLLFQPWIIPIEFRSFSRWEAAPNLISLVNWLWFLYYINKYKSQCSGILKYFLLKTKELRLLQSFRNLEPGTKWKNLVELFESKGFRKNEMECKRKWM